MSLQIDCEWKIWPALSVNKGRCSHQAINITASEPWENSGWKQDARHLAVNCCSHPLCCTLRKLRMRRHGILALDSWGACQRSDFKEPRLLHLPLHSNALNSITWDILFSLIDCNLLMFWPPGLCCKNSYISWLSPLSLQSYLRFCVRGLSPQFCPPNKT